MRNVKHSYFDLKSIKKNMYIEYDDKDEVLKLNNFR